MILQGVQRFGHVGITSELIRCAVWCVLNMRFGEFQCIFTKPHTENRTVCLTSGQLSFFCLKGTSRSPNEYGDNIIQFYSCLKIG